MIELPINYVNESSYIRRVARIQYIEEQNNLCYHCSSNIFEEPPKSISDLPINWELFPKNFRDYPIHLHHNHDTEMSIGSVHMLCNAVLWVYYDE